MTRAPRLSERMRALEECAQIAEERARIVRKLSAGGLRIGDAYAADLGAVNEADLIARLIRERMQNRRAKP